MTRSWLACVMLGIGCASSPPTPPVVAHRAPPATPHPLIHGIVRDDNGSPVAGARVAVVSNGGTVVEVRTDAHGAFSIVGEVGAGLSASKDDLLGHATVGADTSAITIVMTQMPM